MTVLAIALSALTTILSFGSLSFSSFAPVSTFGLSVFLGILFNFLFSPLLVKKEIGLPDIFYICAVKFENA